MKKLFIIAMAIAFCFVTELQAEEGKPLTLIILKNDSVNPKEGESYNKQSSSIYFHNGSWFGGGLDITVKSKYDYMETNPYITVNRGHYYAIAGFSTNSNGSDYFQGGFWYINKFDKIEVFLDIRNYWGIGGETTDYADVFLRGEHPISEKFYIGIDLDYIRYWQDENHNFYFLGPYVGYKVTDITSIFLRVSREWDVVDGQSNSTDAVRLGMEIMY